MPTFEPLTALRQKLNSTTGAYEGIVDQNGASAFPAADLTAAVTAMFAPSLQSGSSLSATANVTALQALLAAGGLIIHNTPGDFYFNTSLIGYDNTRLIRGPYTRYLQANGVSQPMFVNEAWQSSLVTVSNGITDYPSGRYTFTVSGVSVTPTAGATYTHNTVTFTVISTSISGGAGTVTCLASGAPLGSGTLTKSAGTGDATIAFSVGTTVVAALAGLRMAVADCGSNAHGFTEGQYALHKNDTSKLYVGGARVDWVIDSFRYAYFVSAKVAIGSSTGTVTTQRANANIELDGGTWDYNGAYNQANYDYRAHALVFNKIINSSVRGARIQNTPKYCLYPINSDGFVAERLWLDSASDGVHFHGLCKGSEARIIRGSSADDFIAYTSTNDGYAQYDVPNGDMPGDCLGLLVDDIKPTRCGEDIVALYATGSYALNATVNNWGLESGNAKRLLVLSPPSASAAAPTAVGRVVLSNAFGLAGTENIRLGQYGVQMTVDSLDISKLFPGAAVATTAGYINCTNLTVNKLVVAPGLRMPFDIASNRYLLGADETCSFGDVTVRDHQPIVSGSGGAAVMIHWGGAALGRLMVDNPVLSGTSHLFDSAAGGNPEIDIVDWATTTYSIARINWPCRLRLRGGRASAPGGTPPVLLYGSGYTFTVSGITTTPRVGATYTNNAQTFTVVATSVTAGAGTIFCTGTGAPAASGTLTRASGTGDATVAFSAFVGLTIDLEQANNNFGNATNWLTFGTAAGDSLTVNVWTSGGAANAGTNPGINWVSTSGTFNLRMSDPVWQHDASKWTTIAAGCSYYNNQSTYLFGAGIYARAANGARKTTIDGTLTVATLPAAATAGVGARAFVSDANATFTAGIGAAVAAGGANVVPVVSDGTTWRIG